MAGVTWWLPPTARHLSEHSLLMWKRQRKKASPVPISMRIRVQLNCSITCPECHWPVGEHQTQCPWSWRGAPRLLDQAFLSSAQGAGGGPGPAGAHARLPWEVASGAKIPFQDPHPCNGFLSHHLPSPACQQRSCFRIFNLMLKSLHFMYLNLLTVFLLTAGKNLTVPKFPIWKPP